MLAGKRARLVEQLAEIQDSIDFIDAKQRFYDDVLSGIRGARKGVRGTGRIEGVERK